MDYKHLGEGDIPVYGTGGYMLSVDAALSEDKDAIGIGRKGTIDKPYILRAPFWTVDTLFYCIPKDGYDLDFTNCLFQNVDWKKKDESTGVPSLSKVIINNVETAAPSYEEQRKIGQYFEGIDNLITLHQKQCNDFKTLKKYMLQKMFPKKGQKVPEIRFDGFTDDWEQRKFGEILDEFSNKSKTENEYPVLSSTNTGMEYRDGRVSGKSNIGYKIIDNNDLVLSPQNLWLGNININDIGLGIVSPSYKTFKLINVEPDFFRPQIRSTYLMNEYYNASIQGASVVRRNLDIDMFNDIAILIPSVSEQLTIGYFFRNLDNLITLYQNKCEKLKLLKKYMLQNMFPKKG